MHHQFCQLCRKRRQFNRVKWLSTSTPVFSYMCEVLFYVRRVCRVRFFSQHHPLVFVRISSCSNLHLVNISLQLNRSLAAVHRQFFASLLNTFDSRPSAQAKCDLAVFEVFYSNTPHAIARFSSQMEHIQTHTRINNNVSRKRNTIE